ncbi:hypothetical protein H9L14_08085 [Sphingomonas sediminicola]|uniref:Uncharacterized protein n=1 Tax=Sphingomonas sediminicola TaxID=386874 RepID=A0ABX6T6A3_9SPHN|nr:hypothetical protein [Sphingomonas sediminicola]QNP44743.1 hypothetical protein H9L14_08085 [Sphingomonas sediminicola]
MASSLSISRAWDETREIFRRDGGLLVSVALALIVLPEVVVGIVSPRKRQWAPMRRLRCNCYGWPSRSFH